MRGELADLVGEVGGRKPVGQQIVRPANHFDFADVAAHYGARQTPRDESKADARLNGRGAELAKSMGCFSCHGADFRGQQHVPRIAGQREDYLAASLLAYRDNKRTGVDTSMNAAMYGATDTDIRALAHFLSHQ